MTNNGNNGEDLTGTPDEQFNLVSVLYHALENVTVFDMYIEDAEEAGDSELADFFREIMESNQQQASRAKQLLKSRLD